MSAGQLTLAIPDVSPPIPELVIDKFIDAEGYSFSTQGWAEVSGYSAYGTEQISGSAADPKYQWSIAAWLTEAEALQLGSMAKWQDRQYKLGGNGSLSWTDEFEYLEPEPSPHSRTLVTPINPTWNADYEYGYGVFRVKLNLPEKHRVPLGVRYDGTPVKLVTFNLFEVNGNGVIVSSTDATITYKGILSPSYVSSATYNALTVVTLNGSNQWVAADQDTEAHVNATLAILPQDVTSGASVSGLLLGWIRQTSGWSWSAGNLFLGESGALTQTEPEIDDPLGNTGDLTKAEFVRVVATRLTANTINWNPQEGDLL